MRQNPVCYRANRPETLAFQPIGVSWLTPTEHSITDKPSWRLVVHKTVTEFVVQFPSIERFLVSHRLWSASKPSVIVAFQPDGVSLAALQLRDKNLRSSSRLVVRKTVTQVWQVLIDSVSKWVQKTDNIWSAAHPTCTSFEYAQNMISQYWRYANGFCVDFADFRPLGGAVGCPQRCLLSRNRPEMNELDLVLWFAPLYAFIGGRTAILQLGKDGRWAAEIQDLDRILKEIHQNGLSHYALRQPTKFGCVKLCTYLLRAAAKLSKSLANLECLIDF